DLVHAMRIPFEGILTSRSIENEPFLLSVWGNDLTLHANGWWSISKLTRTALAKTSALHSDCQRDVNLARTWGFDSTKPSIVLPGAGGIQRSIFSTHGPLPQIDVPKGAQIVVNPRGLRVYVRNDVFFQAIPLVLQKCPNAFFLGVSMKGSSAVEKWIADM